MDSGQSWLLVRVQAVLLLSKLGVEGSVYPYGFIVSLSRWFGIVLACFQQKPKS